MKCAECKDKECTSTDKDCLGRKKEHLELYKSDEIRKIYETASNLEASGYMKLCRVEELIHFSKNIGYGKLGIAFCIGFANEARVLSEILERFFEVHSVCCKICAINKDDLGVPHIRPQQMENGCNPIGQAEALAKAGTDLNIALGLCMGHDILFSQLSKAPVTTLVVKDRVLAHNPVGALYSGYLRKKLMNMELP